MNRPPVRLRVYYREYCGLCESMLAELIPRARRGAFELELVDIDRDPTLVRRYGERVPVLTDASDRELASFRLTPELLRELSGDADGTV